MSRLTDSPAWQALAAHQTAFRQLSLRDLFRTDPARFETFSLQHGTLLLDYSKNLITGETLALLLALARQSALPDWITRMLSGESINHTEHRAALHTALRAPRGCSIFLNGKDVMPDVLRVRDHMRQFTDAVRSGTVRGHTGKAFTDVVNIGIGGSALGPQMACEALRPYGSPKLNMHFVSNVDATDLLETLKRVNPETTLFIISSKTFTTQETLANGRSARAWLIRELRDEVAVAKHFVAVSTNLAETSRFGILPENVFEFWDWVGGRYSLWSSIGLPIALYIGMENFDRLLEGGHDMDRHFSEAPLEQNMPVILGMLAIWYANFFSAGAQAILPYDQYLQYFPAYLQQLEMESNGKRVDRDGQPVDYETQAVIWGAPGTNGQHSFYQLLHQGTRLIPADFLAPVNSHNPLDRHHAMLLANCLAQTEALMLGKNNMEVRDELLILGTNPTERALLEPFKVFPGNRPSNTLLFDKLDPRTLGMLIALYEHKVFVQGVVWHINPFDQWGVEFGKQLAGKLLPELLAKPGIAHDPSTSGLIRHILARQT